MEYISTKDFLNIRKERIMKKLTVEIWKGEKFYIAQCLEHSNCFTQGKTIEETIHNIKEVIELVLEISNPKLEVKIKEELVSAI